MYDLKDKIVVVTGAANGIGAAIVVEVLEEGVKHVRILDVDVESGVLLQDELNEKYGEDKVKFVKCDVTKDDQFYAALDNAKEENGFIDLLVNNAGVTDESSLSLIRKEIEINLIALINGTIRAKELMDKNKGGRGGAVLNISSIAGIFPVCPMMVYSCNKRAVLQFSTCIGRNPCKNTGVRVMSICYGFTDTPIIGTMISFERRHDDEIQKIRDALPMQSAQSAARGAIEVFQKGESATTWLVHNNEPARDITPNLVKADEEMLKLLLVK